MTEQIYQRTVKGIIFFCICSIIVSCSSLSSGDSGYQKQHIRGYVRVDSATTYFFKNGDLGEKKGYLKWKKGDTVNLIGYRNNTYGLSYNEIEKWKFMNAMIVDNDTIYVHSYDVADLLSLINTKFTVPKDKDEIVWARANKYVSDYSDLKIQTQTDFLVETYNPIGENKYTQTAFKITRQPLGDTVEYEVISNRVGWDKKCAYYMFYGELIK